MRQCRMPNLNRRQFSLALAALPLVAQAQAPRAVNVIVPLGPGTGGDVCARRFAQVAADQQTFACTVENLPGAGGVIAGREFVKRGPDSRTLLCSTSGMLINTPLMSATPVGFDPLADFVPLCTLSRAPFLLVAGRNFPADNLADLKRLARRQAEPVSCASVDIGSAAHLAPEVLFQRMEIASAHVPYRNIQQAIIDVAEGRVQLGCQPYGTVAALLRSERLKVLAVMADTPLQAAPQLPTVAQQGLGRSEIQGWHGLFVMKGTPAPLVAELERSALQAAQHPAYAALLVDSGQEAWANGGAALRAITEAEIDRARGLIRRLKITPGESTR